MMHQKSNVKQRYINSGSDSVGSTFLKLVIPLTGLALKCLVRVVTMLLKFLLPKALKVQISPHRARAV